MHERYEDITNVGSAFTAPSHVLVVRVGAANLSVIVMTASSELPVRLTDVSVPTPYIEVAWRTAGDVSMIFFGQVLIICDRKFV